LSRKEQYIKHQDYVIENLTQENLNLETRLNKPVLELQSHQLEEIENYQNKIKQLSAIISDTKNLLVANEESHKIQISEMRYTFIITLPIVILSTEWIQMYAPTSCFCVVCIILIKFIKVIYKCLVYRDRIKELEKLVDTKTDLIHQQNMTLNLMREITPATNDNVIMRRRWSKETYEDF